MDLLLAFLERALHPGHLWRALRLQRGRKSQPRAFDDAMLALLARILPTGFLHYGYFDDPGRRPEQISLAEIAAAQQRYAELLIEQAGERTDLVLDVGCGMGGLSRMLRERGFSPVALTPDRSQVAHLRATLPDVPTLHCRLEQMPIAEYAGQFGTIYTAESLQYLKLDQALPVLAAVLKPGGRWIACDYFRTGEAAIGRRKSGHPWEEFLAKLPGHGWRIASQRDITPHVLPTLAFIHMSAVRFGLPVMQFAFLRLQRKQPGLHHLLGGVLDRLTRLATTNVQQIDPDRFAAEKRYMLLNLQRGQRP